MLKINLFFYLIFLEFKRKYFGVKYFAEIDVTDNCNLRCTHCYHFYGKEKFEKKELPLNAWKERFQALKKQGVRFILLVGGEPSLRNDILMLADKNFASIHVITNGLIKIPQEFNHLLFLSLDGKPETNDSIRGKGVFAKVMKNYSGDKRVVINMTITKDNYRDLEYIVNIAKDNAFRGVVCNIYTNTTGKKGPLFIDNEERKPIIDEFRRVRSLYPNHFLLTKSMIDWYEIPDHAGFCHWGDEALHFDISWKTRRCFSSLGCSNCGCFAGSFQNPLSLLKTPREMMKLA